MKSFLGFSIANILGKKIPDLSTWKHVVKNIEGCLIVLVSYLIYGLNLAKSSCGWLPVLVHHKIEKKLHLAGDNGTRNLKLLPSRCRVKIDTCYNWRCRIKYTAVMLEIDE
jgi:hypothetical protein